MTVTAEYSTNITRMWPRMAFPTRLSEVRI